MTLPLFQGQADDLADFADPGASFWRPSSAETTTGAGRRSAPPPPDAMHGRLLHDREAGGAVAGGLQGPASQACVSPLPPLTLRPYQAEIIAGVREAMRGGARRVCVQAPTGVGKALTLAEVARSFLGKRDAGRVVITAPRKALIDQLIATLERQGVTSVGAIQARHPRTNALARVQVATPQSLERRERPEDVRVLIVDEAHLRNAKLAEWAAGDERLRVIGLTATPGRGSMREEWDALITARPMGWFIEQGFLSDYRVFAPSTPDLTRCRKTAGEWRSDDLAEVMGDARLVGDVVQTWLERGDGRPTIAFAVDRKHAREIAQSFERCGVPAAYVGGDSEDGEFQEVERAFRAGEIKVVANAMKLIEGIDWPVGCIIDAAPTCSRMKFGQAIGRGLRVNPEAPGDLIILDHAGNTLRHGFVSDLDWSAFPEKGDEKGTKTPAPTDRLPKVCPKCSAVKRRGVSECPSCGHVTAPPREAPETVDGALAELERAKKAKAEVKAMSMEEKAAWHAGFKAFAVSRGKREGWAKHLYAERFGVNPPSRFRHDPPRHHEEAARWAKSRVIAMAKAREAARRIGDGPPPAPGSTVPLAAPRGALQPCRYCGGRTGLVVPGTGPHGAGVKCGGCSRHLGWLPRSGAGS